jgi:hypothetical protein
MSCAVDASRRDSSSGSGAGAQGRIVDQVQDALVQGLDVPSMLFE